MDSGATAHTVAAVMRQSDPGGQVSTKPTKSVEIPLAKQHCFCVCASSGFSKIQVPGAERSNKGNREQLSFVDASPARLVGGRFGWCVPCSLARPDPRAFLSSILRTSRI